MLVLQPTEPCTQLNWYALFLVTIFSIISRFISGSRTWMDYEKLSENLCPVFLLPQFFVFAFGLARDRWNGHRWASVLLHIFYVSFKCDQHFLEGGEYFAEYEENLINLSPGTSIFAIRPGCARHKTDVFILKTCATFINCCTFFNFTKLCHTHDLDFNGAICCTQDGKVNQG